MKKDLEYILSALEYGLNDCEDENGSSERHYNTFQNTIDLVKNMISTTVEKLEWYAVPPYKKNESWIIVNEKGELVATFETKEDCLATIKLIKNKS